MNKIKSLILGSAAGFVAIAGAQAADLPVKAKAVQYVKICSLYGAGFYYIPGTDTCIKLGGYSQFDVNLNSNIYNSPFIGGGSSTPANATARHHRDAGRFAPPVREGTAAAGAGIARGDDLGGVRDGRASGRWPRRGRADGGLALGVQYAE